MSNTCGCCLATETRIKELEQEVERLRRIQDEYSALCRWYETQITTMEAREKALREALVDAVGALRHVRYVAPDLNGYGVRDDVIREAEAALNPTREAKDEPDSGIRPCKVIRPKEAKDAD